jgi:hypothetical protein
LLANCRSAENKIGEVKKGPRLGTEEMSTAPLDRPTLVSVRNTMPY